MDRFSHMFRLAAPILAGIQLIALAVVVVPTTVSLMQVERPVDVRTAMLGDGVDELSLQLEPFVRALGQYAYGFSGLFVVATISTLISLVVVGAHARRAVQGLGDVGAMFLHFGHRVRRTHGNAGHHWGVARDAVSGRGLPFARIRLATMDGNHTIAHTVADAQGQFGFGISPAQAAGAELKLSAHKNGYYFPSRKKSAGYTGIYMDRAGRGAGDDSHGLLAGTFGRALSGAAFWVSVVSVPLVSATAPQALTVLFVGSIAVTVCARVIGLGRAVQRSP